MDSSPPQRGLKPFPRERARSLLLYHRQKVFVNKKDWCAKVTESVAYHTVELVNNWKDGKYKTKGVLPAKSFNILAQSNCMDCHGAIARVRLQQKKLNQEKQNNRPPATGAFQLTWLSAILDILPVP